MTAFAFLRTTGVREENQVRTNADTRQLDEKRGRVDAQAVGNHKWNLGWPPLNFG
jgi:hypothetical protein